jgi:hypothetical protein
MEMPSLTPMVWKTRPIELLLLHLSLDLLSQIIEVHIAGITLPAHAGNADLRLFQIFITESDAM